MSRSVVLFLTTASYSWSLERSLLASSLRLAFERVILSGSMSSTWAGM